jgi:hypothetical protein
VCWALGGLEHLRRKEAIARRKKTKRSERARESVEERHTSPTASSNTIISTLLSSSPLGLSKGAKEGLSCLIAVVLQKKHKKIYLLKKKKKKKNTSLVPCCTLR